MAYEVIYWNMPLCQAQCVVNDITGGRRDQHSFNRSISCGSSSLLEDDDAIWPGFKKLNAVPDIIVEHSRPPQTPSGSNRNSINQETASLADSTGLTSSCCSEDGDVDLDDTFQEEEALEVKRRFRRLTRSLSIRQPNFHGKRGSRHEGYLATQRLEQILNSSTADAAEVPLFDCIFVAGLYHDHTKDIHVPFTRDCYPDGFLLPNGIEELCWPDGATWKPHAQEKTRTYTLVLTDLRGHRTFGYCRRIQAEGDDVCSPLAICILTRHSRARGLFSQILIELTKLYGMSTYSMRDIYSRLHTQPFPNLGQTLEIAATKFEYQHLPRLDQRRGSLSFFLQSLQPPQPKLGPRLIPTSTRVRRIRRPIDFRMDGSLLCKMLNIQQALLLCSTVLQERRLVVISSSLSDLSALFDGIESLIFPMTWQHTLIPALPPARTVFLEAPTPYLIGVLVENKQLQDKDSMVRFWEELEQESLRHDNDCLVIMLAASSSTSEEGETSKVLKRPRKASRLYFPDRVVANLQRKLESTSVRLYCQDSSSNIDRQEFVILCETFLQMYYSIFTHLQDYITSENCRGFPWLKKPHHQVAFVLEEHRDFDMEDYIVTCLNDDYHPFVRSLMGTSMFDEYLRSRIRSLGIQVLSKTGTIFKLRRRKWQKVIVERSIGGELSKKEKGEVNNDLSLRLQRRITLPRARDLSKQKKQPRRVSAL